MKEIPELLPLSTNRWTVSTENPAGPDEVHVLYYGSREMARQRHAAGWENLCSMAKLYNRKGTVPKDGADVPAAATDGPSLFESESESKPTEIMSGTKLVAPPKKALLEAAEANIPTVVLIKASLLERYPENREPTTDAVARMKESIEEMKGITTPLVVRSLGPDRYQIISGETRWSGGKLIHKDYPLPCFVRELDDKEAARHHAVENFQRTDLTEIEEARSIRNMKDTGWDIDQIALTLGREKSTVYLRLKLLKLPEEGQKALNEGNLSARTAEKILSLPDDKWLEAIHAVVSPTHSRNSLSQRDAIELIERDFVQPMQKAKEWEEKRDLLEKENPGAKWWDWETALANADFNSDYCRASEVPNHDDLSPAARANELVVPTWGELAAKYKAETYIGLYSTWDRKPQLRVNGEAVKEMVIAAYNSKPEECIFNHPKMEKKRLKLEEQESERALREEEERRKSLEAFNGERIGVIRFVLSGSLAKTKERKAAEFIAIHLFREDLFEHGGIADFFGIDAEGKEDGVFLAEVEAALRKYFKGKDGGGFEALGRLLVAAVISNAFHYGFGQTDFAEFAIDELGVKTADHPQLDRLLMEYKELVMKEQQQAAVKEAAAADAAA